MGFSFYFLLFICFIGYLFGGQATRGGDIERPSFGYYPDVFELLMQRDDSPTRRPTAEKIARTTHCSVATVRRVAARARNIGLLGNGEQGRMPFDRQAIMNSLDQVEGINAIGGVEKAAVVANKLGCSPRTVYRAKSCAQKDQ